MIAQVGSESGADGRAEDDLGRLGELVVSAGWRIGDGSEARLRGLAGAITRWNLDINLVSRKDIGRLVSYHFCDSASVLPLLGSRWQRCLGEVPATEAPEVLDIGGSNGLPGMVIAALLPGIRLTVCDSRRKRLGFLSEVCKPAGAAPGSEGSGALIPNAVFELARVESRSFRDRHLAAFDLIVARAVTALDRLAGWCLPLLKPGGRMIAYKGSRCPDELARAQHHLFGRGARLAAVTASPWGETCNPLRLFAIVDRG